MKLNSFIIGISHVQVSKVQWPTGQISVQDRDRKSNPISFFHSTTIVFFVNSAQFCEPINRNENHNLTDACTQFTKRHKMQIQ